MCYGLLVAWYITDVFPDYAVGVTSSGGIPIKMKSIGGTKVSVSGSTLTVTSEVRFNNQDDIYSANDEYIAMLQKQS